jgi:hypothetical protein
MTSISFVQWIIKTGARQTVLIQLDDHPVAQDKTLTE